MRIGITRGGTIIHFDANQSLEEFRRDITALSLADRFDAWCMYHWLMTRALRKYDEDSVDFRWWVQRFREIEKQLIESYREEQKRVLKIPTSYQMQVFGRGMVDPFWQEIS